MTGIITFAAAFALCVGSVGLIANVLEVPQPDLLALVICGAGALIFLALKYLWLDAPKVIREAVTLTIVHDPRDGRLYSMWCPELEESAPRMFRGLRTLQASLLHPRFESIDLQSELTSQTPHDLQRFRPLIAELVEFSLLEWLKSTDLAPGYADLEMSSVGECDQVGRTRAAIELVSTPVLLPDAPPRRLLKIVRPILGLPAHARVALGTDHGAVDIETRHSSMSLRMLGGGHERFTRPTNRAGYRIQRALDMLGVERVHESFPLVIHTFRLELRASQNRLTWFSSQAGSERRWLHRLRRRLSMDFGFERLISYYATSD